MYHAVIFGKSTWFSMGFDSLSSLDDFSLIFLFYDGLHPGRLGHTVACPKGTIVAVKLKEK